MTRQLRDKAGGLARAGRIAPAGEIYAKLLAQKPLQPAVLRDAILFHNRYSRQVRQALPMVAALVKLRPQRADTHVLAAETLANCKKLPQARAHADQALALAADDADARFISAVVAMAQGDFPRALDDLEHALAHRPDHAPSLLQKGRAMLGLGDVAGASRHALGLWQARKDDVNLIGLYLDATQPAPDDPVVAHLRDRLLPALEQAGGDRLALVLKLLGKAANDAGDYDAALQYYAAAKAALPMVYDSKRYAGFVAAQCRDVSRADYFGKGRPETRPLLIVGMPRSGSTLIEQILASHPQIGTAGESPSLQMIAQSIGIPYHDGAKLVKAIKTMPASAAAELGARYLSEIGHGQATFVIDKTLHNFELLGLFAVLFPQARIIHALRDPMDTCVSCYMQNLSRWHRYTQDFDSLGHAYLYYRKLMTHWQTVLPNPICEVRYEDTVADPEATARRMLDFLGLPWDPACAVFQDHATPSLTLSSRQVREPVYRTSLQRWRRYEAHLDPLKTRLAPFYPDGF